MSVTPRATPRPASSIFEVSLFVVMVAVIATVGFVVMGELDWISAVFLGGGIAVVAGIVMSLLLRRPKPKPADGPIGTAPRANPGRTGAVIPGGRAEGEPNTTLESRLTGGIPDAGGVGVPATPAARSIHDPAEKPVAGAGGPLNAPRVDEATRGARPGETPGRPVPGDDHGRGPGDRGVQTVRDEATRGEARTSREEPEAPRVAEPSPAGPPVRKPEGISAPRGGRPDDLTRIRGVGPVLEEMLQGMGVYHFDQIAGWGTPEVTWADHNLEGFKGRATRDDWVGQARALLNAR